MSPAPADTRDDAQVPADPASGQPAPGEDPRRWRILYVALVGSFMTLLDVSIVNVALPSIRSGLGTGQNALQWIVSGYALTFGLLLVPSGRIGDARGRKPMFLLGLGLFTVSSVACGLAPGGAVLIAARLVQGAAGGVLVPQVSGLIQQLFRGEERARAFGVLGATIGVSTAVGPLLGGLLISLFGAGEGWRAVFFVNAPIGVVALVVAARLLPAPERSGGRQDLDPVGVALLGFGVVALLLPLIEQQTWHSPVRLLLYPVAAVLLGGWLLWERRYARRGRTPVVDLALFSRRSYALGAGIGLLYFAGFTGVFFTYAQYVQEGDHYSALLSGLSIMPFAVGSGVAAFLGGRIVSRAGRPLVAIGLAVVAVGLAATYVAVDLVPGRGVGWATALPLLVAGIGSGLVISPNRTLSLSEVPVRQAGTAGGVLQTGQRIGAAAGIAATGTAFFSGVAATGGRFSVGFRHGMVVIIAFVLLALALALVDVLAGRRRGGRHEAARGPGRHLAA